MTALQSGRKCGGDRLPLAPLERILAAGCASGAARALDVNPRQIYRWRRTGVSWAQADELAVRVGVHPSAVWGAAWWSTA